MRSAAVLGAGSWGTALALALGRKEVPVSLWGRDREELSRLAERRENVRYLPGHQLPTCVEIHAEIEAALHGRDLIVLAVPSSAVREVVERTQSRLPWVMAAKGLEASTGKRMTEIGREVIGPSARLAALSGPNLAKEIAANSPTATVIASEDLALAEEIQELMISPSLRVYTSTDVVGVELAGALKNVLAIGGGMSDGLGYGDNTKAALLTRGLAEIARLGVAVGANRDTFMGLAGVGDLFATAVSRFSRNYRVGFAIGQGVSLSDALREVEQVAEGVPTARAVMLPASRHGVEMPLFAAIDAVLSGDLTPLSAVQNLMSRTPKREG